MCTPSEVLQTWALYVHVGMSDHNAIDVGQCMYRLY